MWAACHAPRTSWTVIAALAATPLSAQTWQVVTHDSGALIHGLVHAPEYSVRLGCNAPSQGGLSLMEADDHETPQSAPFEMFVEFSGALVRADIEGDRLENVTLQTQSGAFRLPPIVWDEFIGTWPTSLAMSDQLFDALRTTNDLVVDLGRGTAWRYPVDGLAEGLDAAISACVSGWTAAGYAVPADLNPDAVRP